MHHVLFFVFRVPHVLLFAIKVHKERLILYNLDNIILPFQETKTSIQIVIIVSHLLVKRPIGTASICDQLNNDKHNDFNTVEEALLDSLIVDHRRKVKLSYSR